MPQYFRPASLHDALRQREAGCRVIAGATDVIPAQTQHYAWGQPALAAQSTDWLDISGLAALRSLEVGEEGVRIGALVTWSEIARAELPAGLQALQVAALDIGGLQIQNRATVVGNLCNASPAADGVPPLLCLDAVLELSSVRSLRTVSLANFLTGNRATVLRDDELVTAILIPRSSMHLNSAFYKLGARRYLVISIVMGATALQFDAGGVVTDARVSIGACSAMATRVSRLERRLLGVGNPAHLADVPEAADLADLEPIDDVRATAGYRRAAALEVCRRLLLQLTHLRSTA